MGRIPSKWCVFHTRLAGYDVYERLTGKKMQKRALWDQHAGDKATIELIASRMHPLYEFKENGNIIYILD
jgi:hypothetical protein